MKRFFCVLSLGVLVSRFQGAPVALPGFPIGVFSAGPPTEKNFRYVKALGFDYVHRYGLGAEPPEAVRAYLDMAGKCGLRVMLDVSSPLRRMVAGKIRRDAALDQLRRILLRWKAHPALGFWYLYDEPGPKLPPEILSQFHRLVKRITPDVPDAIAVCWIEHWDRWLSCADIIMPDFYPVRKEEFPKSMLNNQAEFFSKVRGKCSRMIPIVQCFGFPRYPNPVEMRYIIYSPLAQRPRGLFFWSYWHSRFEPLSGKGRIRRDYLETVVKPILLGFKTFVREIGDPEQMLAPPNLTNALYSNRQLLVGVWKAHGTTYVLAINNWPQKRTVTIPLEPYLTECSLRPLHGARAVPGLRVHKGSVTLAMGPWETFVWEAARD